MKKISVLIALALCLTIGGAYAAWTYGVGLPVDQTATGNLSIGTKVEDNTPFGAYAVSAAPAIGIEPAQDRVDYTTTLLPSDGVFTVTFTPNQNAPDAVKASALATTVTVTVANAGSYNGNPMIAAATNNVINLSWINNDNGSFTATVTAAQIAACLNLTANNLPNPEAYTAYATALASVEITLTVAAAATNP